jgi:plastocyanin
LTDTDATPVSDEVRGEVSSPPLTPPTAAIRDSGTGAGGGFAPIAISPDVRAAGEVAGRVRLLGKPPVETRINLNADPASARLHPTPLFTRNFVVSTNGGLANAVVAVANVKSRPAVPTNAVVVQFTNCLVEPYVVAATPGQRLRFENAMPLDHVVRVTSYAGDPGFTFTLKAGRSSHSIITSTNEGPLSIACTIHPWETARVWSLNYAAVTDKNGDFRIQGIPPGEYLVGSSHGPSTNFNFRPAIVSPGQLAAVNFSIDAPKR